jgi:hypothetical protein
VKLTPIDIGVLVEPRSNALGEPTRTGVLQCGRVEVEQAQGERQPDEVRIEARDGFGRSHGAEGAGERSCCDLSGLEPLLGHQPGRDGGVPVSVDVVLVDVLELSCEMGVLAEVGEHLEEAGQQTESSVNSAEVAVDVVPATREPPVRGPFPAAEGPRVGAKSDPPNRLCCVDCRQCAGEQGLARGRKGAGCGQHGRAGVLESSFA